jgi:hypothetical protein
METFQVAHLNIQQVNVIVIFLSTVFDDKTPPEQEALHVGLQAAASSAGWAGNVVPVWKDHFGRTKFIAPRQQHPFFESVSYEELCTQVNRTLTIN